MFLNILIITLHMVILFDDYYLSSKFLCSSFNIKIKLRVKNDFLFSEKKSQLNYISSTNLKSHLSSDNAHESFTPLGLLSNINDINNSVFYNNNLSIDNACLLINKSNILYETFCMNNNNDNNSLVDILKNAENFFNSESLWDRSELNDTLSKVMSTDIGGKFGCLLGGKSTGKSLILRSLDQPKVFIVNLRKDSNLLSCLINTLKERNVIAKSNIKNALYQQGLRILTDKTGRSIDFQKLLNTILGESDSPPSLQKLVLELVNNLGPITLVFDEANLALTIDDKTSQENVESVKKALSLFTFLTKEERKLNVLLVSSEHSFPFRLANPRLNFNTLDITNYIFAGEVPPNEMYRLLTNEWKVESDFAIALIDVYGGHIWDVYQALKELKEMKKEFDFLEPSLITSVQECLRWEGENPGDVDRMKEAILQLAIYGFVPLEFLKDPIARVISEYGVGGVVRKKAQVIGLDRIVWRKYPKAIYGIIPSKQSMRLAIAQYLSK